MYALFLSYPPMEAVNSLSPEGYKPEVGHCRRLLGHWGQGKMIFRTPSTMFFLDQSPG